MGSIILVWAIGRVLFMPIITQFRCITLSGYPIKPLGSTTYLLEFGRVLHTLSKT
jgi:hypothetical protein